VHSKTRSFETDLFTESVEIEPSSLLTNARLDSQEPVNEIKIRAIFGVSFGFQL